MNPLVQFFQQARFSDGPRNNGIMNLKATFEILNMSPADSFYQCFQNGVDVIKFQSVTQRHVSPILNDFGPHWSTTLLSIPSCIGW
ncbi:hypothetical protein Y032_0373g182 [Ancylostoma ceylanicum]|uniref:Uncharacterized protein n=1 Tax=Ancylostoma ceylanicum TaxID=53326 RepID=A0A016RU39_9BILA|nr:hypothetical protein Y032_0373g182 [Ancylostoma ceylanicum]